MSCRLIGRQGATRMLVVDLEGASALAAPGGIPSHGGVEAQDLLSALHVDGLVKAAATIRWTRASGRSLVRQRSPGRDIGISGQ